MNLILMILTEGFVMQFYSHMHLFLFSFICHKCKKETKQCRSRKAIIIVSEVRQKMNGIDRIVGKVHLFLSTSFTPFISSFIHSSKRFQRMDNKMIEKISGLLKKSSGNDFCFELN